jgi:hypothetical protein
MLGVGVLLKFVEADGSARVHVLNALADAVEHAGCFDDLVKLMVGSSILDDYLGLAVDGEDDRVAGLLQLLNKFGCVFLEISERLSGTPTLQRSLQPVAIGAAAENRRNTRSP